jgi:ATP-binding cassette subfamily B protein
VTPGSDLQDPQPPRDGISSNMRPNDGQLAQWLWPMGRLGEAADLLARACGLRTTHTLPVPESFRRNDARPPAEALESWLEGAADCLGLQLNRRELYQRELSNALPGLAPAFLHVGLGTEVQPGVLLLLQARGNRLQLGTPDGQRLWLEKSRFIRELSATVERSLRERADQALEGVLDGRRRRRAVGAMVQGQIEPLLLARAWQFRLPIGMSFWRHVSASRLPRRLALYLAMHFSQYGLMLLSWWLIGKAALQGRVESGWLQAWFLLAVTQVPLGMAALRARGLFAIGLGGLLKMRLMDGAFAVEPDATRDQGAGQLLGRVIESEAIERLALTAGLTGVVSLVELVIAAAVLAWGTGGLLRVGLFAGWLLLSGWTGWRFYRSRLRWAHTRREMTNDLVERMVGHRTRLAQELPSQWHLGEDSLLSSYIDRSAELDRRAVRLTTVLSRGWLAVGLASLLPIIVVTAEDPIAVAVALGGVLLASRALGSLVSGMDALGAALVAWQQVRDLFAQAHRDTPRPSAEALVSLGRQSEGLHAPPTVPRQVLPRGTRCRVSLSRRL